MQNSAGFLFYFFLFFYNFEKILLIGNSKTDNTMQNKLQELTERLYNEGLSKGKQEAEEIKASAIRESEKIISDAQKVAEGIVENARKEAEEIRVRVENDLKMASGQAMATLKQNIESLIVTKAIEPTLKANMEDPALIKELVLTIAKAFDATDQAPKGLELILPAAMQNELEQYFQKQARAAMDAGFEISYSKQISGGFRIGPKDGGYMISFAEKDIKAMLAEYLRPASKKLLFE